MLQLFLSVLGGVLALVLFQKPGSFLFEQVKGFRAGELVFDALEQALLNDMAGNGVAVIHLAHHHRASEVMKEVEHRHADQREHYGQSGLNMMAASGDGAYLFRSDDIEKGRKLLLSQIPKLLSQPSFGDGVSFNDFMHLTYNETPLISSVIKDVLVGHEEIEIATPTGGSRSSPIPSVRR